jgi:L-amino acid N-acyltransferase YncA
MLVLKNSFLQPFTIFDIMQILTMVPGDWTRVKQIYESGIATGNATFQTSVPEWEEWDKAHIETCRLVAKEGERMIGWAALTRVSGRCVYAGVAELSVYIDEKDRGKGIGDALLKELIKESELQHFWTLQAGIFPENIASIKMHLSNGFRIIGTREKIGQMNGIWRDTVLLEKRSKFVGI